MILLLYVLFGSKTFLCKHLEKCNGTLVTIVDLFTAPMVLSNPNPNGFMGKELVIKYITKKIYIQGIKKMFTYSNSSKEIDLKYQYFCRQYNIYFSKIIMFTSSCAIVHLFHWKFRAPKKPLEKKWKNE